MGALTGLKILDFSTLLPGPYATLVMADMGAEVVSIAAPGRRDILTEWPPEIGDTGVTAVSAWIRRNKKTIVLDLKTEAPRCLRAFFTFEDGRRIMAAAQWWQSYLGLYQIPSGSKVKLHYDANKRGEVYLTAVERI